MTNLFLKVNKDLFKLGLNPTEILVLAQIMEFNTNTGDCFMSDKALATMLNVSDKTISRTIKALEDRGFIKRETKNIKNGKERHIKVNQQSIEKELAKDNLSIGNTPTDKMTVVQRKICPLHNGQNDLIKDNILIDNIIKDNNGDLLPSGNKSINSPKAELEEISVNALLAMGARYEITDNDLIRIIDTGKLFKIKQ